MIDATDQRPALWIAHITKWMAASFMAMTPVMFAVMLYQNGLDTVPIYVNRQPVAHVNNLAASLVFCWIWLAISYVIFRGAKYFIRKAREP